MKDRNKIVERKVVVKENVVFEARDKYTGELLSRQEVSNLVVSSGLERIARLSIGEAVDPFSAIAIGTGNTGAIAGDTALETEVARATATVTYEGAGETKYVHLFSFGSGESYSIAEAGIFDTDTPESGTMLNRVLAVSPIAVDSEIDLTVTITVTYGV